MSAVSPINFGASSASSGVASSKTRPTNAQNTAPASRATLKPDTVKLSLGGSIKLMRHNGTSPSNIAVQLGISVKDVNTYLGVKTAPAAPAQALAETAPKQDETIRTQPAAVATATTTAPNAEASGPAVFRESPKAAEGA
jgi:hypothetical protein